MSILVKGMKMPKTCCSIIDGEMRFCPFVNTDDDCVLQLGEKCYGTWEEQYADCPLVELPEKHGRLIDADAMCNDLATVDPQYETMIDWCIRVTEAQPTVIEAEDEG